jgi:hypothetical protein
VKISEDDSEPRGVQFQCLGITYVGNGYDTLNNSYKAHDQRPFLDYKILRP